MKDKKRSGMAMARVTTLLGPSKPQYMYGAPHNQVLRDGTHRVGILPSSF